MGDLRERVGIRWVHLLGSCDFVQRGKGIPRGKGPTTSRVRVRTRGFKDSIHMYRHLLGEPRSITYYYFPRGVRTEKSRRMKNYKFISLIFEGEHTWSLHVPTRTTKSSKSVLKRVPYKM